MLDTETKRRIDTARDILVGKVPDPKSQVEQITLALIYKFMDDMDLQSVEWGGVRSFFTGDYERYAWSRLFDPSLGGFDMLNLYSEGLTRMGENPNLPLLFRSIFKNAFLPFRDAETLRLFLKTIHEFTYDHSERLGDAYEYLLSVLGSQGDAGQFRTPRHIIDFIVQVINPQKDETILDPACGTAGFLVSAYKHILSQNTKPGAEAGGELHTDERNRLVQNFTGYDIDPGMIRNAQVNLYLHQFPDPRIFEYDTLSDEDRWNDTFDIILANPPFMTPKGFKATNKRYRIQANRSEVLFVDYIAEHIHPLTGRAAIIVPEGIIFQSSGVYQALRRMLVQEGYLWGVVSLPAGVFQPYSGVKTSILLLDRRVAQKTDRVHFVKIQSDGYDLGAQRRANTKSDLPAALEHLTRTREAILTDKPLPDTAGSDCLSVEKAAFGEDFNLSMDRYRESEAGVAKWEMVRLGEVCAVKGGKRLPKGEDFSQVPTAHPYVRVSDFKNFSVDQSNLKFISEEIFKEIASYRIFNNEVYISIAGTIGLTGLIPDELDGANLTENAAKLVPDEKVFPKYLAFVLGSPTVQNQIQLLTHAVGVPKLALERIRQILIPLPPLAVQRALVGQIEQWQQVAEGARQVVRHYKPHIEVGEDWERVKLGEVCEVMPPKSELKGLPEETVVSFVPMADLNENEMSFEWKEERLLSEVIKGYTYFRDKDVLVAKVTPCFENSKAGIAKNLKNGLGFGSSEFIVLRASENVLPVWIYLNVTADDFRENGKTQMTGTGGLQRVPKDFVANYEIPLPPLSVQQKIVADIERERALVSAARELVSVMEAKIKNLIGGLWERTG